MQYICICQYIDMYLLNNKKSLTNRYIRVIFKQYYTGCYTFYVQKMQLFLYFIVRKRLPVIREVSCKWEYSLEKPSSCFLLLTSNIK